MLAGGLSLWRSKNIKANTPDKPGWSVIKPVNGGAMIGAIAAAPSTASIPNSDRIRVGYTDGRLFLSTNGNANAPTWKRVDNSMTMPSSTGRMCTRLTTDSKDVKRVYACFACYSTDNLWKTDDEVDLSGITAVPPPPA
jgi:hypothetical protein